MTLNDPLGIKGTQIYGISGNTLVGTYYDSNNVSHGFVATVPEPSSVALFGMGIGIVGLLLQLRKKRMATFPILGKFR